MSSHYESTKKQLDNKSSEKKQEISGWGEPTESTVQPLPSDSSTSSATAPSSSHPQQLQSPPLEFEQSQPLEKVPQNEPLFQGATNTAAATTTTTTTATTTAFSQPISTQIASSTSNMNPTTSSTTSTSDTAAVPVSSSSQYSPFITTTASTSVPLQQPTATTTTTTTTHRQSFSRRHKKSLSDTFNPFQVRIPNDFLDLFKGSNDFTNNSAFISIMNNYSQSTNQANNNNTYNNNTTSSYTTNADQSTFSNDFSSNNRRFKKMQIDDAEEILELGRTILEATPPIKPVKPSEKDTSQLSNQPLSSLPHHLLHSNVSQGSQSIAVSVPTQVSSQGQLPPLITTQTVDSHYLESASPHHHHSSQTVTSSSITSLAPQQQQHQLQPSPTTNTSNNLLYPQPQLSQQSSGLPSLVQQSQAPSQSGLTFTNGILNLLAPIEQNSPLPIDLSEQQQQQHQQQPQSLQQQHQQQQQNGLVHLLQGTPNLLQYHPQLNQRSQSTVVAQNSYYSNAASHMLAQNHMPPPQQGSFGQTPLNLLIPNLGDLAALTMNNPGPNSLQKSMSAVVHSSSNGSGNQMLSSSGMGQVSASAAAAVSAASGSGNTGIQAAAGIQLQQQTSSASSSSSSSQQNCNSSSGQPISSAINENLRRYMGSLKFFDENKNYGFIVMDDDNRDIFVHYDDLQKAGATKEFLKSSKQGNVIRFSFSCMQYIGKYKQSKKAVELQVMPSNPALNALRRQQQFSYISATSPPVSHLL